MICWPVLGSMTKDCIAAVDILCYKIKISNNVVIQKYDNLCYVELMQPFQMLS